MKLKEQRNERIAKMNLTFDHLRRALEETGRYALKLVLFAVGVVVVLLVIFLSFENADGAIHPSFLSFDTSAVSANAPDDGSEIGLERNSWRSELENSPPEGRNSQSH
ncbi:MAG: hypothetical protein JSV10_00075 [Candidatus Zixiibacteriota bacterium]|nr:MAG: hypothetical protein JSV10_00075 [candidate division Zixibacteria bacterium]